MKNRGLIIFLFLSGFVNYSYAQNVLLEKLAKQIDAYQSISYGQVSKQKSVFSEEASITRTKSLVIKANGKTPQLYITDDARGYKTVFNGAATTNLDIKNKTYTIKNGPADELSESPYEWSKFIKRKLVSAPGKIKLMTDTTINNANYYHIKFPLRDSIGDRVIYDLCFDKTTGLPVYTKQLLEGKMGKGGMTSDEISTMITENNYSAYNTTTNSAAPITGFRIPAGYNTEKKLIALAPGDKAPEWALQDLKGRIVSAKSLQGSLVLIDFSFNACAACMLSIPVLKKLHNKYKDGELKIFTINTSDTKKEVMWFAKKNGIKYPILLKGAQTSKAFGVSGYPTFYLIDKQGKILSAYEGYGEDFEKNMVTQIEKARR